MTMRSRSRTKSNVPRKRRLWVSTDINFTLTTALVAGQQFTTNLTDDFKARVDRNIQPGDTLHHLWVKGSWSMDAAGDGSSQDVGFGVGMFNALMDAGEFPSVLIHQGDYQLHDVRALGEGLTVFQPMQPSELASVDIESAGSRTVTHQVNQAIFVAQLGTQTPSSAVRFRAMVTVLWLF